MEWMSEALCAEVGSVMFFPEAGENPYEAKKICSLCEVRPDCLEYAMSQATVYGIWGGTTEADRRRLKHRQVA